MVVGAKANDYQIEGDYYKTEVEHWDYVVENNIPYLEAMIIKYLTRWRMKDGHKDLRKAQHFLQKLFEVERITWNWEMAGSTDDGLQQTGPREGTMVRRKVPAKRAKD
jgi:hypothetical protein